MCRKTTGEIIKELRAEKGLTQKQLADMIFVSDRTVSKWERDYGCPDMSLICDLAKVLDTSVDYLLSGEIARQSGSVSMKKAKLYRCNTCHNVFVASTSAEATCCGKKLTPLELKPCDSGHKIDITLFDGEYLLTTDHPMTKEHYIELVAVINDNSLLLCQQYPEWSMQARVPSSMHGLLVCYCSEHGAFWQKI